MTCVPLVVCIGIVGWAMVDGLVTSDNSLEAEGEDFRYGMNGSAPESPEMAADENSAQSPGSLQTEAQRLVSVQYSQGGQTKTCQDAQVLALLESLVAAQTETDWNLTDAGTNGNAPSGVDADRLIAEDPYPLALVYADGTQVWYTLRGSLLTRQDGQISIYLTQEQVKILQEHMEVK